MLLDTNILIYMAQPGGEKLQSQLLGMAPAASQISRVEALGFHRITPKEDAQLRKVFGWVEVLPMNEAVADAAIALRRARNMKLGDALIAATALLYRLPLMTRNEADFRHLTSLTIINPFASS